MKAIILEDENRAVNHLRRLIHQVAPEMKVLEVFDTVRDTVTYLEKNPALDLIFSDVQLADGISFEIFSKVKVDCPIIFSGFFNGFAKAFLFDGFHDQGVFGTLVHAVLTAHTVLDEDLDLVIVLVLVFTHSLERIERFRRFL